LWGSVFATSSSAFPHLGHTLGTDISVLENKVGRAERAQEGEGGSHRGGGPQGGLEEVDSNWVFWVSTPLPASSLRGHGESGGRDGFMVEARGWGVGEPVKPDTPGHFLPVATSHSWPRPAQSCSAVTHSRSHGAFCLPGDALRDLGSLHSPNKEGEWARHSDTLL
jgi:hypothetical protein